METLDKFHKILKSTRTNKKISQKKMSIDLDISERNYQNYEYGIVIPSSAKLLDIANYFDVSTDYLLGRTDNPNSHKL